MIRYTLDFDALAVDAFTTTSEPVQGPVTLAPGEEAIFLRAPITAHTDPCDVCCQQQ